MNSPADTIREALGFIQYRMEDETDHQWYARALAALTELEQQAADATKSASWLRENWNRDLAHMRAVEAERDRLADTLREYADLRHWRIEDAGTRWQYPLTIWIGPGATHPGQGGAHVARAALDQHTKEQT